MVKSLTDISIFPVSSDWNVSHSGQMENRSLENLTLIDLLSAIATRERKKCDFKIAIRNQPAKGSLRELPCCADHRLASSHFLRK